MSAIEDFNFCTVELVNKEGNSQLFVIEYGFNFNQNEICRYWLQYLPKEFLTYSNYKRIILAAKEQCFYLKYSKGD